MGGTAVGGRDDPVGSGSLTDRGVGQDDCVISRQEARQLVYTSSTMQSSIDKLYNCS